MTYQDLMDAARMLAAVRDAVGRDDGPGVVSPAWRKINHAQQYVVKQAELLLSDDQPD